MTFNLYHFCILILYFHIFTFFILFWFIDLIKVLFNSLIFIRDFINKIAVIFNIGFLLVAIYISIYCFHKFLYFINLNNISIEYFSNYTIYSVNNNAFDNNTSIITNKKIYLFINKNKYNLISIDLYSNKPNMV